MTPEGLIKYGIAAILLRCHSSFGVDCYFWYNASTGIFDPRTRRFRRNNSRHSIKGVSDILGLLEDGTFIAVEVKAPKGRATVEQKKFLEKINSMGGIGLLVFGVDDFKQKFKSALEIHKNKKDS